MRSAHLTDLLRDALPPKLTVFGRVRRDHHPRVVTFHGEHFAVLPVDPDTATAALQKSDDVVTSLSTADQDVMAGRTSSLDDLLRPSWLMRRPPRGDVAEINIEVEEVDATTARMVVVGSKSGIDELHRRVQSYEQA